jgi:hypothetical protein
VDSVEPQLDPASFNPMSGECDRVISAWPPSVGQRIQTDRGFWYVKSVKARAGGKHALTLTQPTRVFNSTADVHPLGDWPEGWGLAADQRLEEAVNG